MNYYFWSGVINAVTSFLVAALVFIKNRKTRTTQIFIIFAGSVCFWAFSYAAWVWSMTYSTADRALLWIRLAMIGSTLIPPAFTEFVIYLLRHENKWKRIRTINLGLMLLILSFAFSTHFISGVGPIMSFKYWPIAGPLFYPFHGWFAGNVICSHYLLIESLWKTKNPIEWKRNLSVFIGTLIGFLGGMTNHFLWYKIKIPPIGNVLVAVYVATVAFSIVRYRLLDIEVVIKRTLVFAGLFAMVMGVVVLVTTVTQNLLGQYFAVSPMLGTLLSVVLAVFLYDPTRRFLVSLTDKYLFQKKQEIKLTLRQLSEKITNILDLKQIGKTILDTLEQAFRLDAGMIFIRDNKTQEYRLVEYFGFDAEGVARSVKSYFQNNDLINYFRTQKITLSLDQVADEKLPNEVAEYMKRSGARVFVPLNIDDDHTGALVLGKKKSDQEFTENEIDYFPTIVSQVSLAIRNARLVETVLEEREAKVRAEHLSKRVEFAGLIKHEIQNKLVHIEMPANATSTYCVPRLQKSFKERDEEHFIELCGEIVEGSKKINFAANQIRVIAQTAKGGVDEKDSTLQELDCKVLWEDAKKESGLVKQCDFESKMPQGFLIFGNYHSLQRVFVNLIRNAYDAMKDKVEPIIKLRCSYENIENKRVAYFEVEDTGCGIPKEIRGKIFEDGFSTKLKPDAKDLISSGHGQGLAACKLYIESIHNGKMWVESENEQGATFKFWIPMKNDEKG